MNCLESSMLPMQKFHDGKVIFVKPVTMNTLLKTNSILGTGVKEIMKILPLLVKSLVFSAVVGQIVAK